MRSRPRMSPPAQKARPAPVTTITRASGSASAVAMHHRYSAAMRPVHALRRSGRLSVTVATPAAVSYRTARSSMARSCQTAGSAPAVDQREQLGQAADHRVGWHFEARHEGVGAQDGAHADALGAVDVVIRAIADEDTDRRVVDPDRVEHRLERI